MGGGGGGGEKLSSSNISLKHICLRKHFFPSSSSCEKMFSIFFSVLFTCAKYYHYLIKLLNNDVQGAEGTQHEKRKKPLSSFVESTNYIIEEEIHAPCGSGSVNATVHQMFEELKTGICLTTTLKQAQTVMKKAVTHLLTSILKLSHYKDCILLKLKN